MKDLDASVIRRHVGAGPTSRLDKVEVLPRIDSTNSYLLQQSAPESGRFRVVIAGHQTAGRGRHDRSWQSPPGTGLCLSLAYTFTELPDRLPNLTLSLGVGVVNALSGLGIGGVSLKWPNDIVAMNGKLGGMLTEVQSGADGDVTVVAGIGLNIDLPEELDLRADHYWTQRAVGIRSIHANPPSREVLAGAIIEHLLTTLVQFDELGFASFVDEWRQHDWLHGSVITVEMPDRQITGVAAGIDEDGALLVDTRAGQTRVMSGSIIMASLAERDE